MGLYDSPAVRMECLLPNKQTRLMFIFLGALFLQERKGAFSFVTFLAVILSRFLKDLVGFYDFSTLDLGEVIC
jgi:hypothetical protein